MSSFPTRKYLFFLTDRVVMANSQNTCRKYFWEQFFSAGEEVISINEFNENSNQNKYNFSHTKICHDSVWSTFLKLILRTTTIQTCYCCINIIKIYFLKLQKVWCCVLHNLCSGFELLTTRNTEVSWHSEGNKLQKNPGKM